MNTHAEAQATEPGRLRKAVRRYWMIWLVVPMLLLDGCAGRPAERTMCGPDTEPACIRRAIPCASEQPRPAAEAYRRVAPCCG